jgi:hypothetical protein
MRPAAKLQFMPTKSTLQADLPTPMAEHSGSPLATDEFDPRSVHAKLESLTFQNNKLTDTLVEQGNMVAKAFAVIAERFEILDAKLKQFENRLAPKTDAAVPASVFPGLFNANGKSHPTISIAVPENASALPNAVGTETPGSNLYRVQNAELPASNTKETFQEAVHFKPAGQAPKLIGSSFYRGEHCNFNPYGADHASKNFCRDFVLRGHLPESKIISKTTRVTAFGSCFAQNITAHLSRLGFDLAKSRAPEIYVSAMGEGLVNVHALLQQFAWTLDGQQPPGNLWHGYDAKSFGYDENIRVKTREVFLNTDVFILTLGLSEVWFDEVTGGIFWRAVPMSSYDSSRHKFRVCTFAETKQALEQIHASILKHVPSARIVFTLSPIPLAATFRDQSCITANCASKAILKAALDEFLRDLGESVRNQVFYFPAFEIINELFPRRFREDCRHPYDFVIPAVMKLFEAYYCESDASPAEAEALLQSARTKSIEIANVIYR